MSMWFQKDERGRCEFEKFLSIEMFSERFAKRNKRAKGGFSIFFVNFLKLFKFIFSPKSLYFQRV